MYVFFFKQKTAYEMRISDWSSDVCSSDLASKWEFEKGLNGNSENDFAIFRLADIYLMKAEALVRMGVNNVEATRLVNEIRKRAFDDPAKLKASVTLEDIYQERRFEFDWEVQTRKDMRSEERRVGKECVRKG